MLQPNNHLQYGYQSNGAGPSQQQLPNASQHSFFASPDLGLIQFPGTMGNLVRRPSEEDKIEEVKKKLKKRKIATDEWQYYIKSPDSWDFDDINPSGLNKGTEVILLYPVG